MLPSPFTKNEHENDANNKINKDNYDTDEKNNSNLKISEDDENC